MQIHGAFLKLYIDSFKPYSNSNGLQCVQCSEKSNDIAGIYFAKKFNFYSKLTIR